MSGSSNNSGPEKKTPGITEKELLARIDYLRRERNAAVDALETASNLGNFRLDFSEVDKPVRILAKIAQRVRTLFEFDITAFYLVSEEDSDVVLTLCDPEDASGRISAETEQLIESATFAWALSRNKPTLLEATQGSGRLLLHAMSTPARTRGLFMGVLQEKHPEILDVSYSLLSTVLFAGANALESFELYSYIHDINQELQDKLKRLARSEQELLAHRNRLEEEVSERTRELTNSNRQLKKEVAQRERAQALLTKEKDFTDAVVDTAQALVIVLDKEGRVVRFNQACEAVSGYSAEEMFKQGALMDLIPDEDRHGVEQTLELLFAGHSPVMHENHWITKNGSKRLISWSNAVLASGEGEVEYLIGTGIDITQRRQAQIALKDSESRFRAIFMQSGIGIAICDHQGMIRDANPVLARMLGYTRDELNRLAISNLIHPEHPDQDNHNFDILLASEVAPYAFEERFLRMDASFLWARVTVSPLGASEAGTSYSLWMIEDVTERRRMEDALRKAEATYRDIFEHAVEGLFQAKPRGGYITANPALADMFGYDSPEELIGSVRDLGNQLCTNPKAYKLFLKLLKDKNRVANYEMQALCRDGLKIWVSVSASATLDKAGEIECVEGLVDDITDRKISEMRLRRKASIDQLTNIPNRFLFLERFEQMLSLANRQNRTVALLYIDLDDFKIVNDTHGHHVGDVLLSQVAERLGTRVRRSDTAARLGGDEFSVLLDGVTEEQALAVADQIIESLKQPYEPEDVPCVIGVSVGISLYPRDGERVDVLLKRADMAMYAAKESGGNQSAVFRPEMEEEKGSE